MPKRYVLTNKKRFILFLTITCIALYCAGMIVNAGAVSQEEAIHNTYIVHKGDTLWEIASDYCPDGDLRQYVFELKKLNQIINDTIYDGQIIQIPKTDRPSL